MEGGVAIWAEKVTIGKQENSRTSQARQKGNNQEHIEVKSLAIHV